MVDEVVLTEEDLKIADESEEVDDGTGEEEEAATPADEASTKQAALEIKLAELEASNSGLIKSLSAQRGIRQDLQEQLDGIKTALNTFKVNQAVSIPSQLATGKKTTIPVDFDKDGNPYLDPVNLIGLTDNKIQQLEARLNQMQQNATAVQMQTTEQEALSALLSEKAGYVDAHKEVTKAWNYLKDELFDAYLEEKGLPTPKTADQAIDIAVKSDVLLARFRERFPTIDMESVMEAHLIATPRYLKKALDKALVLPGSSHEELNTNRPASLALANSSGGENQESLIQRVADMSPEDFMKLDAATMSKIDKLLETHG